MISIVLADDQPMVRAGLRAILESEPGFRVVGDVSNGLEAVVAARDLKPDIVLLDVRMPVLDGIEAARLICAEAVAPRVVLLTTFDADEYVFEALKAGASGFLLKDISPERLLEGMYRVVAGEELLAPQAMRRLIDAYVRRRPRADSKLPGEPLTARESEVLAQLARGRSNGEIAQALVLSEATVKTHVAHVLEKLDLRDRIHAVIWAYENGLVEPSN